MFFKSWSSSVLFLHPQLSHGQMHLASIATELSLLKQEALKPTAPVNQTLGLDARAGDGFRPLIPSQACLTLHLDISKCESARSHAKCSALDSECR